MTTFRSSFVVGCILLAACSAGSDAGNAEPLEVNRVTETSLKIEFSDPDDWHRLALFGNWDFIDPGVWRAIVTNPECNRATALAIFWKSQPEYYLEFGDRSQVPEVNREGFDLVTLIRDRWQSGAYTKSSLAFDPDIDAWPVDIAKLRAKYGERVDRMMPASMRVKLEGRHFELGGRKLPGSI